MDRNFLWSFANVPSSPILSLNQFIFSGKPQKIYDQASVANYKKILIPKDLKRPKFEQKGLIFVWPQRRTLYYSKELICFTWVLAHALYWLHVIDILPSGAAVPFKQPPWIYEPPLHRPKSRDFIIEPDWDSQYL